MTTFVYLSTFNLNCGKSKAHLEKMTVTFVFSEKNTFEKFT